MVNQYKKLRMRDTSGGTRSAWRITVRQLESMVRLSESMARIHCSEVVLPKHVQEAFRLLNKSIIRVETPEINFEADEPQQLPPDDEVGGNDPVTNGHVTNGDTGEEEEHPPNGDLGKLVKPVGKKIRVTYEQYRTISNLRRLHIRRREAPLEDGEINVSVCANTCTRVCNTCMYNTHACTYTYTSNRRTRSTSQ